MKAWQDMGRGTISTHATGMGTVYTDPWSAYLNQHLLDHNKSILGELLEDEDLVNRWWCVLVLLGGSSNVFLPRSHQSSPRNVKNSHFNIITDE